jgi:ABC-2 type transport system permease protein
MELSNLLWRSLKWRFQNPATIFMNITQPLIWLLLFSTMFQAPGNSATGYTAFFIPGLLVMTALTSAGISCGIANYYLKSGGAFFRIYISPVKRCSIVLAQILDVEVLSFIGIGILLLLSLPLGAQLKTGFGGLLLVILLLFLCVFFVASASYTLSFLMPDENAFIGFVNTLVMVLFFVSTAFVDYQNVRAAFRIPVMLNPFSHVITEIRALMLETTISVGSCLRTIALMLLLCIIMFCIAVHTLRSRTEK